MRPRTWAGLLTLLVVGLLAVQWAGSPGPVEAHALLVRADPPANSQLAEPPSQMTLYFSEGLERRVSTIRVLDSARARVETGVEFDDADDALMRVNLTPLDPGYYSVIWETLSKVDGHRITGQYPLTILNADGSLPEGAPPAAGGGTSVSGTNAKPERVVTRWLLLIATSVLTGALAFTWAATGIQGEGAGRARGAVTMHVFEAAAAALLVLLLAGIAELLLQAREVFGSPADFQDVLADTRWGERWLMRNALLVPLALGMFVVMPRKAGAAAQTKWTLLLLAIAVVYLAIVATVSHAAAGRGSFWATTSDFVHLVAASVWIGMLLQVVLLVRWAGHNLPRAQQPVVVADALRRFSLAAVFSVALLLCTGTFNAVVELRELNDLLDTGYGQALLIKLLLLIPLLIAGSMNAYLFRPQVVEEADRAETNRRGGVSAGWEELARTLSRTVRAEFGLALVVLLVVGVLVQVSPSRVALAAPTTAGKFIETRSAGGVSVTLQVDPNEPGQNAFSVYLTGDADSIERVRLVFEADRADAFQADLVLDRSPISPLIYNGGGAFINEPGEWDITANLRRTTGSDIDLKFDVSVAGAGAAPGPGGRGGAFASPREFSTEALVLLGIVALLSAGMVLASLDKPGRPAGLMGDWADWADSVEIRPSFSLAALVVVGIGLGIVVGTHGHEILGGEQARQGNMVPTSPESIARGRMLFAQNCTTCHGDTGRGDGPLAPQLRLPPANLYDHIPYHPDQFFFNVITNGYQGVMPAFGSVISEEDRWNILNFLRDQFGQGAEAQ